MARVRRAGGPGLVVPGLYAALLAREREHQRGWSELAADGPVHPRDRRLLDALESGQPAVLQGRRLRGWGLPKVPLRREDAFRWFAVAADDRIVPAEPPEDEAPGNC